MPRRDKDLAIGLQLRIAFLSIGEVHDVVLSRGDAVGAQSSCRPPASARPYSH